MKTREAKLHSITGPHNLQIYELWQSKKIKKR